MRDPLKVAQLIAAAERPEEVEQLLALGLNPNIRDPQTGRTPLHMAVSTGSLEQIKALLQIEAARLNLGAVDKEQNSLLDLACQLPQNAPEDQRTRWEMITLFLEIGFFICQHPGSLAAELEAALETMRKQIYPPAELKQLPSWIHTLKNLRPASSSLFGNTKPIEYPSQHLAAHS
jgi:ankyrin repeat protein